VTDSIRVLAITEHNITSSFIVVKTQRSISQRSVVNAGQRLYS